VPGKAAPGDLGVDAIKEDAAPLAAAGGGALGAVEANGRAGDQDVRRGRARPLHIKTAALPAAAVGGGGVVALDERVLDGQGGQRSGHGWGLAMGRNTFSEADKKAATRAAGAGIVPPGGVAAAAAANDAVLDQEGVPGHRPDAAPLAAKKATAKDRVLAD